MAGEHLTAATEILQSLEPITSGRGGDPNVKAMAAIAHALIALAEQQGGSAGGAG